MDEEGGEGGLVGGEGSRRGAADREGGRALAQVELCERERWGRARCASEREEERIRHAPLLAKNILLHHASLARLCFHGTGFFKKTGNYNILLVLFFN